jgi:hypothetical protein
MFTAENVKNLELISKDSKSHRTIINLLGVGGIGSNFVSQLLNWYNEFMLRICDHDTLELHNMNRTNLFELSDIGKLKVTAAYDRAENWRKMLHKEDEKELVMPFPLRVDSDSSLSRGITIDARDTMDPAQMHPKAWIKLAYDGGSNISFTFHPYIVATRVFSLNSESGYEVVPSFYAPAALLSALALHFLRFKVLLGISPKRAGTVAFDIDEQVTKISYDWQD